MTDGRTDGRTIAYSAYAVRRALKITRKDYWNWKSMGAGSRIRVLVLKGITLTENTQYIKDLWTNTSVWCLWRNEHATSLSMNTPDVVRDFLVHILC